MIKQIKDKCHRVFCETKQRTILIERFLSCLGLRKPRHIWGRRWVQYIWAPIIGIFLTIPSILSLIALGQSLINNVKGSHAYLSYIFFYLIIPSQYYLGVRYYNKNHLYNVLTDCHKDPLKWLPNQWGMISGILVSTISLLTVNLSIFFIQGPPPHLEQLGLTSTGIIIFLVVYWFLSWMTICTNMIIFCVIFSKYTRDMKQLENFMANELVWKWDKFTINDLARWIVNLKFGVNGSIDKLESFYTVATILGAIGLGPMVEFQNFKWDPYLIFYVIIYVLMQIIFMAVIYRLTKVRGDLYKIVKSPMIMSRYLARMKNLNNTDVFRMIDMQADHRAVTQAKIDAHCHGRFGLIGPPGQRNIQDNEIELQNQDLEIGLEDYNDEKDEIMAVRVRYRTMAGVDWLILEKILSERWADFSLLGVQFGGTDVIKKGIGLTALLVMGVSYLNNVTIG